MLLELCPTNRGSIRVSDANKSVFRPIVLDDEAPLSYH